MTDRETADIVQMVLAGKVNKGLVGLYPVHGRQGHRPVRHGRPHDRGPQARRCDIGYVGEIVPTSTPSPSCDVLEKGYIPVISTVGCDNEGNPYNINADTAAARIAAEPGRGESDAP